MLEAEMEVKACKCGNAATVGHDGRDWYAWCEACGASTMPCADEEQALCEWQALCARKAG
jgi:hypothetical protein